MDYTNRVTNDEIISLEDGQVFVFGSNLSGIHGGGAAKLALNEFGAKWGQATGIQGNTYAIPTKSEGILRTLTVDEIKPHVDVFLEHVKNNPEHIYGGLFHETTHGLLEKYIHRPNGFNEFPEPFVIILQIAALDKIDKEWANKFAGGFGSCKENHPLLFELVRIYREDGFGPIRAIYYKMNMYDDPILFKVTLISDLNNILKENGVKKLINL